jgi:hypothetical protein
VASYPINKGVGQSIEVKGLRAQYVMYAVLGTVLTFLLVLFFCLLQTLWLAFVGGAAMLVGVWSWCIYANKKYGEHGLQQYWASKRIPWRIAFVVPLKKLIRYEA